MGYQRKSHSKHKRWEKKYIDIRELTPSDDGEKIAAVVQPEKGRFTTCVNGETWDETFERVYSLKFNPDNQLISLTYKDYTWALAVDHEKWEHTYDFLWNLTMTPDGKGIAVSIKTDPQLGASLNGQAWENMFFDARDLAVSPDGKRTASTVQIKRADGTGYCWGSGDLGNLGTGSNASSNVPVAIAGGLRFSSLRLGLWTACGVTTSGDGYCWGQNGSGELGVGSKTPAESLEPRLVVDGHHWQAISAGVAVTCGVRTDDQGFCWGGNVSGERGDGPFPAQDFTSPVPVVGNLAFQSIDADWCSCGVAGEVAYCWGPGGFGCIGDGARVDRGIPTRVAGQP